MNPTQPNKHIVKHITLTFLRSIKASRSVFMCSCFQHFQQTNTTMCSFLPFTPQLLCDICEAEPRRLHHCILSSLSQLPSLYYKLTLHSPTLPPCPSTVVKVRDG